MPRSTSNLECPQPGEHHALDAALRKCAPSQKAMGPSEVCVARTVGGSQLLIGPRRDGQLLEVIILSSPTTASL